MNSSCDNIATYGIKRNSMGEPSSTVIKKRNETARYYIS